MCCGSRLTNAQSGFHLENICLSVPLRPSSSITPLLSHLTLPSHQAEKYPTDSIAQRGPLRTNTLTLNYGFASREYRRLPSSFSITPAFPLVGRESSYDISFVVTILANERTGTEPDFRPGHINLSDPPLPPSLSSPLLSVPGSRAVSHRVCLTLLISANERTGTEPDFRPGYINYSALLPPPLLSSSLHIVFVRREVSRRVLTLVISANPRTDTLPNCRPQDIILSSFPLSSKATSIFSMLHPTPSVIANSPVVHRTRFRLRVGPLGPLRSLLSTPMSPHQYPRSGT